MKSFEFVSVDEDFDHPEAREYHHWAERLLEERNCEEIEE